MTFTDFLNNKFIWVPVSIWFLIQIWKFIFDLIKNRKVNLKRLLGAGGMPSSHSAVVSSLATLIGKSEGLNSPIFALSCIFALVVMYDATGVRRAAGKQARILNQIINSKEVTIQPFNNQSMLIPIDKNAQSFVLRYHPKYLQIGMIFSSITMGCHLIRKLNKKNKQFNKIIKLKTEE